MTATHKQLSLLIVLFLLAACAPTVTEPGGNALPEETLLPQDVPDVEPTATLSSLERYYVPPYYSPFYGQVVEDSKSENGLLIYSTLGYENWEPLIRAFQEHYPWINVISLELEPGEVFERYSQENGSELRTADIIISSDIAAWQDFTKQGQVLPYRSQEDSYLPSWAKAGAGIYALSSDPLLIIYNKQLVENPPVSMQDIGTLSSAFTSRYASNIVTYDIAMSQPGFAVNWFWVKNQGETGWDILKAIGQANPVLGTSERQMVDDIGSGDGFLAYFVSAIAVLPRLQEYPDLGWSYIEDGQPIVLQSMAITQANSSPNSAKLMTDFLLSQEGQLALALGGLTPYRADIVRVSPLHIEKVSEIVGQDKLIFLAFDPQLDNLASTAEFIQRWDAALRKPTSLEQETQSP